VEKLVEQVKDILVTPKPTWVHLKNEELEEKEITRNYLVYLAAVPAIAGFLGKSIIGQNVPFFGQYRVPFFNGLLWAALIWGLSIAFVYVNSWIVNSLAERFAGQKNQNAAFKLVAFSFIPYLLAGVFNIVPGLSGLYILGLYGIYLFYVGVPILMQCPEEKALPFTIFSVVICLIVSAFFSFLASLAIPTTAAF